MEKLNNSIIILAGEQGVANQAVAVAQAHKGLAVAKLTLSKSGNSSSDQFAISQMAVDVAQASLDSNQSTLLVDEAALTQQAVDLARESALFFATLHGYIDSPPQLFQLCSERKRCSITHLHGCNYQD